MATGFAAFHPVSVKSELKTESPAGAAFYFD
jgi:hypothetical protein